MISMVYRREKFRKISKKWEVLARRKPIILVRQIRKLESSVLFCRDRTSQFFDIFLNFKLTISRAVTMMPNIFIFLEADVLGGRLDSKK